MYIAVCEDEQVFIDGMVEAINSWKEERNYKDIYVKVYISAEDLWDDWEKGRIFDALFLDIHFKYMNGFELAQRIRETDVNIPIIFVTNQDQFVRLGYEVSAYRYLKKPIRQREVRACLDYCYQNLNTVLNEGFIISKQGFSIRMPYRDVLYIISGIHTVRIVTRFGKEYQVPLKGTFEKYAETFPKEYYVRCHRGYIVNIVHAVKYTQKYITLTNGFEVPIGKSYANKAIEKLHTFFYKVVHV